MSDGEKCIFHLYEKQLTQDSASFRVTCCLAYKSFVCLCLDFFINEQKVKVHKQNITFRWTFVLSIFFPVLKTPNLTTVFSVTETKWILACDISCHQCFCPDHLHLKKSHIADVMEHHHWTLKNNKKKNNSGLQKRQAKSNTNSLLPSPDVNYCNPVYILRLLNIIRWRIYSCLHFFLYFAALTCQWKLQWKS